MSNIRFSPEDYQLEELFNEYLDNVYYPGYAQQLAEDPIAYGFEYETFKSLYS